MDFGRFRRIRGEYGPGPNIFGGIWVVCKGRGGKIGPFRAFFSGVLVFLADFRVFRAIFCRFKGDFGRFSVPRGEYWLSPSIFINILVIFTLKQANLGYPLSVSGRFY